MFHQSPIKKTKMKKTTINPGFILIAIFGLITGLAIYLHSTGLISMNP